MAELFAVMFQLAIVFFFLSALIVGGGLFLTWILRLGCRDITARPSQKRPR